MFQQTIHGSARSYLGTKDIQFYLTWWPHILHSCYIHRVSISLIWEGQIGHCVGPCRATACSYPSWASLANVSRHPSTFISAYILHLQDLLHFPDLSSSCDLHLLSKPPPPPLLQDHFFPGTHLFSLLSGAPNFPFTNQNSLCAEGQEVISLLTDDQCHSSLLIGRLSTCHFCLVQVFTKSITSLYQLLRGSSRLLCLTVQKFKFTPPSQLSASC